LGSDGTGTTRFPEILEILVVTMTARTADSALRARRPRARKIVHFLTQKLEFCRYFPYVKQESVDPILTRSTCCERALAMQRAEFVEFEQFNY
jgi:hypothetical protein